MMANRPLSISGTSSTTSSRSSSAHPAETRKLVANTTTVSRNIARDNAVQINGAVARKIYNLNFENLVIHYQGRPSTRSSARREGAACIPEPAPQMLTAMSQPRPVEASSLTGRAINIVIESTRSDLYYPNAHAKNVVLYSKISNRRQVVRATFQPSCSVNFIARRIVKRLGVKLESNNTSHAVHHQDSAPDTNWIDITCRSEGDTNQTTYRFYIIKNSPYDLFFGCGASAQSNDSGH
ncbi:hypothetical protein FB567DRAFT_236869 [Paraphoma chrysanthemicola]|uniref:Uncharacterized protein n=1 Tax=Paraphoma chrysanthemicola TaxID=798071 RepID=A0A8K0RGM0_9PLEO|nr:hypothetical protein FB567DRAFT_236869 [Paraphoma chrysanthemicola]